MYYKETKDPNTFISPLSVGTWAIGAAGWGEVNEKDSIEAIKTMVDNGVNLIDTAPSYGLGHSEEVVGKAIKEIGRDKVLLLSKCGVYRKHATGFDGDNKPIHDSSYKRIMMQIDESLMRLQTDHLDIYLVHWPDNITPLEETAEALKELKKAGKIRFSGVSNFDEEKMDKLYELGVLDFIQFPYSMVNRSKENIFKKYSSLGVSTMSYGSLGAGILTGTIRQLPNFAKDDARLGFYNFFTEPNFSKVMSLLECMDTIANKRNVPLAQIAVNWAIQHPYITTSLTGVRNAEEARINCQATNWKLDEDEINTLNMAIDKYIDFNL